MFEFAGRKFIQVGSQFGLIVSIPKTEGLAMGAISEGDVSPAEVGSGMIRILHAWAQICQVIVKQLVRSTVGLPNTNIFK